MTCFGFVAFLFTPSRTALCLTTHDGCHFRSQLPSFVSHLSLSFSNLGVNFQLLGCHSLILTIKMIASYMYQNVGVRGVKRHIILSDRNPLNTTVFNGSMEDNNPSDEVQSNLQISMVG